MEIQNKSKEESIIDYVKLKQDFDHVNELYQNDLTERIQVEEELRRSLSLVEATLESTENGILVISNEGQLVKANRRFAELWHISDELIDSRDDNRMLQFIVNQLNEPDFFLAKVRELYANPLAESFDLLYFKDGRIFERFSKPMRVEGQTQARVWSFLDITERTRTETERQVMYEISSAVTATDNLDQMLRQIHQSLKKVVYAENCFVALYEPDTHLFSFPYFVDQFDEKPNPVPMEKSCSAYVYRTGKPMLITNETFDRLRKENEVELVGSPSPSWVGIPLQTPFSTIGVLVLQHYSDEGIYHARDVEFLSAIGNQMALVIERKKSEDEIKRMNVQLQETIANKDKFFSIIAHDLRSPFSSFLGFTQILSEELGTMSRQEISRIAESMRTSAFNVYRLLNSLLEWSQFQRGLTSFNPEKQLLKPRVVDCLDLISDSGKRKDIEITHEIPEDATVYADKHMLDTILRNLLSNAVKFTRNGGRVFVSSRLNENRVVEISITDSGLGMDQDMLDKLFTIDEQVNRQGTNGESSSGLGLIICKEFIEKHGGKIWALSEEGKGTTFSFKLGRMPKE